MSAKDTVAHLREFYSAHKGMVLFYLYALPILSYTLVASASGNYVPSHQGLGRTVPLHSLEAIIICAGAAVADEISSSKLRKLTDRQPSTSR